MGVRMRVVCLLIAAFALASVPTAAHAKWVSAIPESDGPWYAGPSSGSFSYDGHSGSDPDEPLGPERVAAPATPGTKGPATIESDLVPWLHVVHVMVRIGLAGWIVR